MKDLEKKVIKLYKKRDKAHKALLEVDVELDNFILMLYKEALKKGCDV